MNPDKSTCWYQEDCHEEMIRGARGELWPVLEKSSHWPILAGLISAATGKKKTSLLDIGCGAGCLGQTEIVKDRVNYTGVDLPDVIKNVAIKTNPDNQYISIDITTTKALSFIYHYNVVVMNAFIDIMHEPVNTLIDVIDNCSNYVIIHRQFVTDGPTMVKKASSYGGFTFISHINRLEFNNAVSHFKVIKEVGTGLGKDNYSYLLKRRKQ